MPGAGTLDIELERVAIGERHFGQVGITRERARVLGILVRRRAAIGGDVELERARVAGRNRQRDIGAGDGRGCAAGGSPIC